MKIGNQEFTRVDQVLDYLTRRRSTIIKDREIHNLNGSVKELEFADQEAQKQKERAEIQDKIAEDMQDLADANYQFAQDNLRNFEANLLTPELWSDMATVMKHVTQRYLNNAIEY